MANLTGIPCIMTLKLQSPWVAAVLGVLAYTATTALFLRPEKIISGNHVPAALLAPETDELVPSWAFKNPEVDQLVSELRTEREAVRLKEKELQEFAARLAAERQEINTVTQRIATLQADIDRTFVRIREDESLNLKRLAKVYGAMTPEAASKIMVEFEDEAAVKIFAFMKEAETAPILENISKSGSAAAHRVALISDRLRLLTSPAPTDKTKAP